MIYFGGFLVCALIIFFAGRKLAFYGNLISEKTGWGKAWIGLMLVATVTSLPELMAGISSSAIIQSPDLAVGDILGSCAFNLGILALMDAFVPKHKPLFGEASPSHVLSAALGIILVTLAGVALYLPTEIVITSWIGLTSILFVVIYLASVRLIFVNERRYNHKPAHAYAGPVANMSAKKLAGFYLLFAGIIVAAALALPFFGDRISKTLGLDISFVGTLFLAVSTSLPEVAVSISAVRMGSIDMAVGGLLGSNIFNILILALDDLFYTKGHILKDASDVNIVSVFAVIIMSAVVIIGLSFRSGTKRYWLAWDASIIFLVYLVNILLLYYLTA